MPDIQHALDWITGQKEKKTEKGGQGSGNFGHAGRPGKVGGSSASSVGSAAGTGDVKTMFNALVKSGGFTYHPIMNKSPKGGFALSVFPQFETVLDADSLSPDAIRDYLKKTKSVLKDNPDAYLGGWYDQEAGKIYLDVSVVVFDAKKATFLAREHNQEGYYDLNRGETVIVKEESERRKEEKKKKKPVRFQFERGTTSDEITTALLKLVSGDKKKKAGESEEDKK